MKKQTVTSATKSLVTQMKKMAQAMPSDKQTYDVVEREGRINAYVLISRTLINEFQNRLDKGEIKDLSTRGLLDTVLVLLKSIHEETQSLIDRPVATWEVKSKKKNGEETYRLSGHLPGQSRVNGIPKMGGPGETGEDKKSRG